MNVQTIIHALRVGGAVQNPTPFKWAGVAVTGALVLLPVAQSHGWFMGVSGDDIAALVLAALSLIAQIITTDKIGLLSRKPATDGMRDKPLPPDADASAGDSGGFPRGPFFDS